MRPKWMDDLGNVDLTLPILVLGGVVVGAIIIHKIIK